MKKLGKLLLKICIIGAVVSAAGLITLRLMYPPEKVKQLIISYAQNSLHREVRFDDLSLDIIGVTLTNFAISEATTFEQGTFLQAKHFSVDVRLLPLLKGEIQISDVTIDGLDVNIVALQDGSFNFDSLGGTSPTEETQESEEQKKETDSSLPINIMAEDIIATDCNFHYKDLQTGMDTELHHINIRIDDFDLEQPFAAAIQFTTAFKQAADMPVMSIPVKLDATVFLAKLDLSKAYVTINKITAAYKTVQLYLQGKIEDFTTLHINISGSLKGINNTVFEEIAPDLPHFELPSLALAFHATVDTDNSAADITNAAITTQGNELNVSGNINWSGTEPVYTLYAKLHADLAQLVQMTDTIDFSPTGLLDTTLKATEKNDGKDVSGTATISNLSALYDPLKITETNGTITLASLDDISSKNITGRLNGEQFETSFSYKNIKDVMNIIFKLNLDKLVMSSFPGSADNAASAQDTEGQEESQTPTGAPATADTLNMNITADINLGGIEIPYLRSEGFTAHAALTGFSESMKNTNGEISFLLKPGSITDLDTFVKRSKAARLLLLPLKILHGVAKKLNIDLFSASTSARKGEIAYTSGEGVYTFTNGVMQLTKTSFVSSLTDIKGTGTVNFNSNALDMKVSATLLTKQTPIIIKIGGTMDNPSGKLDVLNTVTSVVGGVISLKTAKGLVTGTKSTATNVVSGVTTTGTHAVGSTVSTATDATKATVKAIGSLFKKKKEDAPTEESASTLTDEAAQ